MAEKNDDWKLTRHDALFGDATENATRESRGYVPIIRTLTPEEAEAKRPGWKRPPPPKTMRAVLGGRVLDLIVDGPLQQALESGAGAPIGEGSCPTCARSLQSQPGLTDDDLIELAKLTTIASKLLTDPHPGVAQWGMMTSGTLNAIGAILRRSGI